MNFYRRQPSLTDLEPKLQVVRQIQQTNVSGRSSFPSRQPKTGQKLRAVFQRIGGIGKRR